ncbi:MAG: PepSY domain-containing protein [Coriobacteriales bacterium]|nr:PepSY domain-containing protein [Coriobacteriales bacterium]
MTRNGVRLPTRFEATYDADGELLNMHQSHRPVEISLTPKLSRDEAIAPAGPGFRKRRVKGARLAVRAPLGHAQRLEWEIEFEPPDGAEALQPGEPGETVLIDANTGKPVGGSRVSW